MDLQAVIVFVGGFAFCAVVGYIVSVFGAKEQVSSLFVQTSTPLCQYSLTSIHLTTTHGGNWVGLLIN